MEIKINSSHQVVLRIIWNNMCKVSSTFHSIEENTQYQLLWEKPISALWSVSCIYWNLLKTHDAELNKAAVFLCFELSMWIGASTVLGEEERKNAGMDCMWVSPILHFLYFPLFCDDYWQKIKSSEARNPRSWQGGYGDFQLSASKMSKHSSVRVVLQLWLPDQLQWHHPGNLSETQSLRPAEPSVWGWCPANWRASDTAKVWNRCSLKSLSKGLRISP